MSSPADAVASSESGRAVDRPLGPVAPSEGGPERPGAVWACSAVCAAGFAALVAMVLTTAAPLWWDESWYLEYVPQLHRLGFSVAWLRAIRGGAGPLFGVVHALFEPLTGLAAPGVRVVTIGVSALTVAALGVALRSRRVPHPFAKAAALLAVPILYGPIGTAMTEMPSMLFFVASLALLFPALDRADRGDRSAYPLAVAAGLACGVASTGRPQYILAALASAALVRGPARRVGLLYGLLGLVVPAPLFLIWGGLVPPYSQGPESGLSIPHCLIAFAYAGVIYCLFDVGWLVRRPASSAAIVALAAAANLATGFVEHFPLHRTAMGYLGPGALHYYGLIASGVMLGFGAAFVAELGRIAWDRRDDPGGLFACGATALLLFASIRNARMFTGRYIAPAVPLLLILGAGRGADTYGKAARLALGCAIGLVSLWAYLYPG